MNVKALQQFTDELLDKKYPYTVDVTVRMFINAPSKRDAHSIAHEMALGIDPHNFRHCNEVHYSSINVYDGHEWLGEVAQ